jgi:mannose-6-phosphate isomerase-like protein (cupin superfamily)
MPDAMTRLLQLKEAVARHTHAEVDEVIYVVAGDGAIRLGENAVTIGPGSVTAVPRGTPHAIERRGRTPLIVLSTLAGAPCPTSSMTRAGQK